MCLHKQPTPAQPLPIKANPSLQAPSKAALYAYVVIFPSQSVLDAHFHWHKQTQDG